MSAPLERYRVRIGMHGISRRAIDAALPGLRSTLARRSHLESPTLAWDAAAERLVLEATVEAPGPDRAAGWLSDDLLQITVAEIDDLDELHFEVLSVRIAEP